MVCEILCVGTELLLGDIVNTDGAFIAREMAAMGFSSYHQTTVGDNPGRLREALRLALSRSDVVIMTGGLGPTCDDITKNAAAEAFGRKLIFDEATREDIARFFEKIGRPMTENNLSQCWIPEGAAGVVTQICNDCGAETDVRPLWEYEFGENMTLLYFENDDGAAELLDADRQSC